MYRRWLALQLRTYHDSVLKFDRSVSFIWPFLEIISLLGPIQALMCKYAYH